MMSETAITDAQMEILHHTKWRAAGHCYCGSRDDPDLAALCDAGLMTYLGTKEWLPDSDGYFTATSEGYAALKAQHD